MYRIDEIARREITNSIASKPVRIAVRSAIVSIILTKTRGSGDRSFGNDSSKAYFMFLLV